MPSFLLSALSHIFDRIPKKEAIGYSWELLTDVYKISPDRLYVTYFEGDEKNGLLPDLEAKQYWQDRGVPADHIVPGNAKDNFWGTVYFLPFSSLLIEPFSRNGCNRPLRSM